jgi:DNA-binding NtrC family response regulator
LIVEDDPLIALELAAVFQSAGAQVLSLRTLGQAAAAVAQRSVCAALLDYRLGDDNVATLCEALVGRKIPFVLYSGYSDLRESFPKYIIVQKPASGETLLAAIAGLLSHDDGSFAHEHRQAL